MDDDDKFWTVPAGKGWNDAGKMLRELNAAPSRRQPKKTRARKVQAAPTVIPPQTPAEWVALHRRAAALYRRMGDDMEADRQDRLAERAALKVANG